MRHAILALSAGAVLSLAGLPAKAMPVPPTQSGIDQIETVADGCGPGNFRDRWGYCRRGAYGPPPYYGPPGYRPPPPPSPYYRPPPPPPRYYNPYY